MKKKFEKLIDLKSLITIVLTLTLTVIIFAGIDIPDETIKTLFVSVLSSVFTYYFTKKASSKDDEGESK